MEKMALSGEYGRKVHVVYFQLFESIYVLPASSGGVQGRLVRSHVFAEDACKLCL